MVTPIRGIEFMVVVTSTGMLLMLGMPSFTTFLRNREVRSTAEAISNGLRAPRSEAAHQYALRRSTSSRSS